MTKDELIALVRKNPVGIGCGVLSLGLAGAIYFRGGQVPDIEADVAQKSAEGERFKANLNSAHDLQEQYDALVAANKEIDTRIVRASQFGKNLQYFYKLEAETGVKLTTDPRISPPGVKKDAKAAYVSIPCSLSVQGSMTQLLTFLRGLENGTHYCRVMGLSLSGIADRSSPLNLSVNVELLGLP